MAGNWDWHRRKEYSKREIESLSMLREILSASKPREKRAVISKFNPHFYALFPDGVKHYEQRDEREDSQKYGKDGAEVCEHGQTAKAELLPIESRIFTQEINEKENRDGI